MSQYQLIALDMDGTLLNSKKEISPGCREAIEKALAEGKEVVLSTGPLPPGADRIPETDPGSPLCELHQRSYGLRFSGAAG